MQATEKFDITVRSTIIRGDVAKSNKGLGAVEAANQHQMNRITGFLPDGTEVAVAQRPGRGGMDFNKLLSGKTYAVAADGMSPVYEKDAEGRPTKVQKVEEGRPLYSSSGFYSLSSKEYPALDMFDCYTQLQENGERVLLLTAEQLGARQALALSSELDLEILSMAFEAALSDEFNLVARHDEAMNKKRSRGVSRAKEEAEDAGETYAGVAFKEVSVSKKDGNPFIYYAWRTAGGEAHEGYVLREAMVQGDRMPVMNYFSPAEAMEHFTQSADYKVLEKALVAGEEVQLTFVQGHTMRTSVSFRRKCENVRNAPTDRPLYGDAVYIHAATNQWTRGIIAVIHSMHPNFPTADYDSHHYVAACRQAEVGMTNLGGGRAASAAGPRVPDKFSSPKGMRYDLARELLG